MTSFIRDVLYWRWLWFILLITILISCITVIFLLKLLFYTQSIYCTCKFVIIRICNCKHIVHCRTSVLFYSSLLLLFLYPIEASLWLLGIFSLFFYNKMSIYSTGNSIRSILSADMTRSLKYHRLLHTACVPNLLSLVWLCGYGERTDTSIIFSIIIAEQCVYPNLLLSVFLQTL